MPLYIAHSHCEVKDKQAKTKTWLILAAEHWKIFPYERKQNLLISYLINLESSRWRRTEAGGPGYVKDARLEKES